MTRPFPLRRPSHQTSACSNQPSRPARTSRLAGSDPILALLAATHSVDDLYQGAVPFAVQVTLGQDYLPNRIGTASGVTLGLAISIGGLAAPLFGFLADSYGLAVSLAALAVLPVLSVALAAPLCEPRPALA